MLRTLFFFGVMALGLGASAYSRFAALLLYLWFAIFRPQEWVWTSVESFHLSLVIGALVVVPCLLTGRWPRLMHPLGLACLAFLATGVVAQSNALRPDIGWRWLDFLARVVLITFLATRLITSQQRFIAVMAVIAGSLSLHSAKGGLVYAIAGGDVMFGLGVGGAFGDNDHYALAVVMVSALLVACMQNVQPRWLGWIFAVAIPLNCLTVVGTFARSGFLALVVAAVVFSLLQRRRALALATVVLVGAIATPLAPAAYVERIETIRTYREVGETSALSRLHFWRVAWNMARSNPLGIGVRNYEALYDRYDFLNGEFGRNRAVHSSHFQVLAENGFAGFGVWAFLLGYTYVVLFRVRRRAREGWCSAPSRRFYLTTSAALISSQSAFVIGGAFLSAAHNDITWYTFGLVAALDYLQRAERSAARGETAVSGGIRRMEPKDEVASGDGRADRRHASGGATGALASRRVAPPAIVWVPSAPSVLPCR